MTEPNKTRATKLSSEPERPQNSSPEKPLPQRRVGSLTLGVCLIAAGILFGCYYFVPGFNGQLVLEIAPAAGLVLLGCEVLFFAARPGQWKYDFVSVFVCLVLIVCCFGMLLLPAVWDEISPERWHTANQLGSEYTELVYDAIHRDAPDIALRDVSSDVYLSSSKVKTLDEVKPGADHLELTVNLYGPYDSVEAFAADCRTIAGAVQTQRIRPDAINFAYDPVGDVQSTLNEGTARPTERYQLRLDGVIQQDWTAGQMADQTTVEQLLDEENDLPEDDSNEEVTEQNT